MLAGFLVGFVVGGFLGVFIMALLSSFRDMGDFDCQILSSDDSGDLNGLENNCVAKQERHRLEKTKHEGLKSR